MLVGNVYIAYSSSSAVLAHFLQGLKRFRGLSMISFQVSRILHLKYGDVAISKEKLLRLSCIVFAILAFE